MAGNMEKYNSTYAASCQPQFWNQVADQFHWNKGWNRDVPLEYNFDISKGPVYTRWFAEGETNICYNSVDRHLAEHGAKPAIIWEGNDGEEATLTFSQLHQEVCRFSNVLKSKGVQKGDRVTIYMPMIPQIAVAMLACARIGAIHSVVFGGFSAEALASRIQDAKSTILLTCDAVMRGTKSIELKQIADQAMQLAASGDNAITVEHCVCVRRLGRADALTAGRDCWWHELMEAASAECVAESMGAEDPLFMLYTSGSTGTPKGVLHTTGGYMVYAHTTFNTVFAPAANDVYWCTADCGWITGHTYIVYGPLLAGTTSIIYEGVPTHPAPDRFWELCAKHKVNQFYTAPTAIRVLAMHGDEPVKKHDLSSLKVLGTVGEPINPEAWKWYSEVVGGGRCPIVDTWWQTETGGHAITPIPHVVPTKPGCATVPFYGVQLAVIDPNTKLELPSTGAVEGHLVIKGPWPGIMRGLYNNQKRFEEVYFSVYPGYYFTGDGCRRDEDGYYWITGRADDVLVTSGHNIGTAEVEAALTSAGTGIAEAAVVGFPHAIKGTGIYAYCILAPESTASPELVQKAKDTVANKLGRFASPEVIQLASGLPKTRSGKIMRRILRKIADPAEFAKMQSTGDQSQLGDTSTLADSTVVDQLLVDRAAVVMPSQQPKAKL